MGYSINRTEKYTAGMVGYINVNKTTESLEIGHGRPDAGLHGVIVVCGVEEVRGRHGHVGEGRSRGGGHESV